MLASIVVASALAAGALAQSTPLAAKRFQWDNLPYKADTDNGVRGPQLGYNRCNGTTQHQDSLCQTAVINSIDDFCLWVRLMKRIIEHKRAVDPQLALQAPPEPGKTVGDIEGEMVAWCTKEGYGTRIIPEGALQGVQFIRTPHYVQVVGYIDQVKIDMQADDYGGEMARLLSFPPSFRGNPLGGLLFSNAFGGNSSRNGTRNGTQFQQVIQWHNFMGGAQFCLKACDPSYENGWAMCEHIFDRIGCTYNAPSTWSKINGTFESCLGDDQLYPGQYIENGRTMTYTQPPESLGPITTVPYTPFTPSSSSCTPYTSASIYTAAAQLAPSSSSSSASSSAPTSSASGSASATASSGSGAGSAAGPASTGTAGGQQNSQPGSGSGAEDLKVAGMMVAVVAGLIGFVAAL
ncbi:hypothetical protein OF846_002133 [Rhodotorula toruloides]|nr:hypothetical protein OF846_002133 [Rhodotorula toruloides]